MPSLPNQTGYHNSVLPLCACLNLLSGSLAQILVDYEIPQNEGAV